MTLDSRAVLPGDLYAALPGAIRHGASYGQAAEASGAAAVLTDPHGEALLRGQSLRIPVLVVPQVRARLGELAAQIYGRPAEKLHLFGVTGTNGKTTSTYLMDAIARSAGQCTGLIGTVSTRIADQELPSVRTTPEAPELQALLAVMVEQGVDSCAIEISSQALAQHRVAGTQVTLAGFTNFSQDHLELHGDMASYLAAKQLLLTPEYSQAAVVVVDDDGSRTAAAEAAVPVTTLSAFSATADWQIRQIQPRAGGHDFLLAGPAGEQPMHCPIPGKFNVYNAALAAVMLCQSGRDLPQIAAGLAAAPGVPGRMERIGAKVVAVVDYAHSPEAVAAAVQTLQPTAPARLIVVLGAGGDRDRGKRSFMGAAAAQADVLIITDDNPRTEDPAQIRAAIRSGAESGRATIIDVADRAAAIRTAVQQLHGPEDVLLVAGKGHERGQEVDGQIWPFDDRVELARALSEAGMS